VYISEKLRKGQIKGLKQDIKKIFAKLYKLKEKIQQPTKGKKRNQEDLEKKIKLLTTWKRWTLISRFLPKGWV